MAKDVFGGGFLSQNKTGLASQSYLDQKALEAQLRLATQQQLALAYQNASMDPALVQQKMQELGQQDADYQAFQAQQSAATQKLQEQQRVAALTPEQRAREAQATAQNDRYGSDLSWLDPSFQRQANLLGTAAGASAAADPNAIAQQSAAMARANELANANLSFQSPAQQEALMQQWAQVQGGQGAPSFMGNATQEGLMQRLLGVQAPQFSGDADQRAVLNQALGMATNSGPGSLTFDTSGRQGEQYGNLQGIIAGGGATAIEMANRQKQRADSEAWLRGQREADMADYAERGLTGSGMELLSLSSDRQAAAGRNSLADLETAKALEERRLGAINSAAGLATNMRGQTIDEQGLLNTRATSGLGAASSVANSMRNANIEEQQFLNTSAREQAAQAAGIASTMRGQDYNEKQYLDQRAINALTQQTGLSTTMRNQTADEQVANRNAQQAALGTLASTSTNARGQSAQEAQSRAAAADSFAQLNQAALNSASSQNTQFLQNAYQSMMNNRLSWEQNQLNNNIGIAQGQQAADAVQNAAGGQQASNLGASDATNWNNLSADMRNQILSIFRGGQQAASNAQAAGNAAAGQIAAGGVGSAGTAIGAIVGGASAGSAAGGMTAGQGALAGAQVGSQALTNTAQTEEEKRRATATGY